MGLLVAGDLLTLPVRLHDIELARPVDVVLDLEGRRVLGLEVRCGDEVHRFLPLPAVRVDDGEIAIGSPLTMLDELPFYRARGRTLGSLRGGRVARGGAALGTLRDLAFGPDGEIREVVVQTPAGEQRVAAGPDLEVASPRLGAGPS
jgi:hypothetical protein